MQPIQPEIQPIQTEIQPIQNAPSDSISNNDLKPQPSAAPVAVDNLLNINNIIKPEDIVRIPGDGNCQLRAILYGYSFINSEVDDNQWSYHDLRLAGIKYAQENYERDDDLKTYIQGDIEEYNEDQNQYFKLNMYNLKKMSECTGQNGDKVKELIENEKKQDDLNKIHSIEEYLKKASENSFWCSTTHIYCLSCLLNVPIVVHDQQLINRGLLQPQAILNPKASTLKPIELLRVNNNHYNLIFRLENFSEQEKCSL